MDQFDIIGALRQFAESKGWHFFNGVDAYVNIEMEQGRNGELEEFPGDLILTADLQVSPVFSQANSINGVQYSGLIMLGRKIDPDNTYVNLDEYQSEKYDKRLKYLMQTLYREIGSFACDNGLTISTAPGRAVINKFDLNADFYAVDITLTTE